MRIPEDVKNWRAPRRTWRWITIAAVTVAFLCIIGPMDYADQLSTGADVALACAVRGGC